MPPYVSRKRRESASPPPPTPARKRQKNATPAKKASRTSVFDAVDTLKQPPSAEKPANGKIFAGVEESESSSASESDVDSDDFEDVTNHVEAGAGGVRAGDEQSDEDESWEDALHEEQTEVLTPALETPGEDLELTLTKSALPEVSYVDLTGKKQGPSKRDKKVRDGAHKLHVQSLMWHNHMRNHWINDKEVQKTMVAHLNQSQKMKIQLDSWRRKAGIPDPSPSAPPKKSPKSKTPGKGKGRGGDTPASKQGRQSKRDWVDTAGRPTANEPDLSHGDPVLPLLNTMAAWWRQRFTITAPGLRKYGYRQMRIIKEEMQQWRGGESDLVVHGERVANLKDFQSCARKCEGSRDIGAQLFAALLRGLGIEARLVASLQPLGYGFTKQEEAELRKKKDSAPATNGTTSKQTAQMGKTPAKAIVKKSTKPVVLEVSDTSELSDMSGSDDSDTSVVDMTPKRRPNKPYDNDLFFPNYWVEAVSSTTDRVFPVDPFVLRPAVATSPEHRMLFEAKGKKADTVKQVFAYVVAFSPDYSAKDVTVRYLKNQIWPGRTKGTRVPNPKIAQYDRKGQITRIIEVDWWQSVLRVFKRLPIKRTRADDIEDEAELRPVQPQKKQPKEGDPDTLAGYKSSTKFVLEQHLRRDEALLPRAKAVKTFQYGKGEKAKEDPVYLRKDVVVCRTGESWHKEGRQIRQGEQPLKMVKVRAVTLTRKREIEETERETGEKAMQGMYGIDQTEWIIPPPIKDGVIPKNGFGNIDAFVPQMIPKGAIHLPMRGTVRVCKKLEIDFAEAVTGFEFGNKMAVPVIEGVVVAEENAERVTDAWEKYEEERKAREEAKREKQILQTWRKFLMGLRVLERMKAEYEITIHDETKERNPFANRKKQQADAEASRRESEADVNATAPTLGGDDEAGGGGGGGFLPYDEDTGGGFLPEGQDAEITNNIPHRPSNLEEHHELKIEHDEEQKHRPSLAGRRVKSLAELAAQHGTKYEPSEHEEELEDEEPPPKPEKTPKPKKTPARAKTARAAQPKPRGRKAAVTPKPAKSESDELSDLASDDDDDDGDESATSSPDPAPPPRSTRATRASARSAAKESQQKIRSHYFRHESTMEIDDSEADEEDELSAIPDTPVKKGGRKVNGRKT